MELNLTSARIAREVEAEIKAALARLSSLTDRKSVLERVAVDVLAELDAPHTAKQAADQPPPLAGDSKPEDPSLWERIRDYCQAHPTRDGKFKTVAVAEALIPDKLANNRAVALSTIYTSVKRRSVGDAKKDPCFVVLGKGRFRLATVEERTKAMKNGAP